MKTTAMTLTYISFIKTPNRLGGIILTHVTRNWYIKKQARNFSLCIYRVATTVIRDLPGCNYGLFKGKWFCNYKRCQSEIINQSGNFSGKASFRPIPLRRSLWKYSEEISWRKGKISFM